MVIKMKANMTNKQRMIRGQILNEIYVRGPISRVDIARNTGITPATTTAVTAELIQDNLIKSTDIEVDHYDIDTKKTSGRKKILLTICNKYNYYVGIELARDFVTLCLTDNLGNIVDQNMIDITTTQFLKKSLQTLYWKNLIIS
ncbi:winged helix-turn-helix transcriptional regulator [Staphylococcus sp. Mo2-1]